MKSFKTYLTENTKDVVDEKYLIKELSSGKFKNNLEYVYDIAKNTRNEDTPQGLIYRGVNSSFVNSHPITLLNYSTERVSANTSNLYNLLVSNYLPSWKTFPKRNKSFICSTSVDRALAYSEDDKVCIVVPHDSTPIGICNTFDFWYSFGNVQKELEINDMSVFNRSLQTFMTNVGRILDIEIKPVNSKTLENSNSSEQNLLKIIDALKSLTPKELNDKKLSNTEINLINFDIFYKYITNDKVINQNKKIDLLLILDKILDPQSNKFSIDNYKGAIQHENVEVWMEGPSILISNIHVFVDICDRYYKNV